MTPVEIIIAVCLGVAPGSAGVLIGYVLCAAYSAACDRWDRLVERWDDDNRFLRYSNGDRIEARQVVIFVFWTTLGLILGGFASGVYVQNFLDLYHLLGVAI